MNELVIHIGWEYFLGIMASLVGIAWYTNGRFTAIETSIVWLKDSFHDLKVAVENINASKSAFGTGSPIELKPTGQEWLVQSGLKDYIDQHKDTFLSECKNKQSTNPYEVQKQVFSMFDSHEFPADIDDRLKRYAYEQGTSMDIIRRVGGIYMRNICLDSFGMNKGEIDTHEVPTKE